MNIQNMYGGAMTTMLYCK